MNLTLNEISIVVGFIIILLAAGANWGVVRWVVRKCQNCKIDELASNVARIDERTKNQAAFSESLFRHLANAVRQHTEPRRDLLIDKLGDDNINLSELEELKTLLTNRVIEGGLDVCTSNARACNMSEVVFRMLLDVVQVRLKIAQGKEAGHGA